MEVTVFSKSHVIMGPARYNRNRMVLSESPRSWPPSLDQCLGSKIWNQPDVNFIRACRKRIQTLAFLGFLATWFSTSILLVRRIYNTASKLDNFFVGVRDTDLDKSTISAPPKIGNGSCVFTFSCILIGWIYLISRLFRLVEPSTTTSKCSPIRSSHIYL